VSFYPLLAVAGAAEDLEVAGTGGPASGPGDNMVEFEEGLGATLHAPVAVSFQYLLP